jgi:hypothetical protein
LQIRNWKFEISELSIILICPERIIKMGCCGNIEEEDKKVCILWVASLGVVGLIVGAFCLGFSFNIVELNETAIVEDTYSPKIYFDSTYDSSGYY